MVSAALQTFVSTRLWSNRNSSDTDQFFDCSDADDAGAAVKIGVLSSNTLMSFRTSIAAVEEEESVSSMVCRAKLQPATYETAESPKSKVVGPVRHHPQSNLPINSAQRLQRSLSGSPRKAGDEKIALAAPSDQAKTTRESIDSWFEKVTHGIEQPEHISKVIRKVFDQASEQQHSIPMYAELCVQLEKDAHVSAVAATAGEKYSFKQLLLDQCKAIFDQLLCEENTLCRKQLALGNIKLIGHLLVNGMLPSKFLVDCASELICQRTKCSEALESLCALMMVAAPSFDTMKWQHHDKLLTCFAAMRKFSKDKTLLPRARFLMRDVLDVREAGWPTSAKNFAVIRAEAQLREAHVQKPATKLDILSMAAAAPAPSPNMFAEKGDWQADSKTRTGNEVQNVRPGRGNSFDLKGFRRTLAAILGDLSSDRNVSAAVQRVRLAQVPEECQAEQFCDLLTRIVEEPRGPVRRSALAFAAGLAAAEQSAFDREQCLAGLAAFFEDVYPDLCDEVPRLPAIVKSELSPTFCNVYPKAEINSRLPPGVRF